MNSIEHFIDGKTLKGSSKRTAKVFNPATGDVSSNVNLASRADLNKANRKAGTYGNGDGMDMSHTKKGKLTKEKASTNRARNKGKAGSRKNKK